MRSWTILRSLNSRREAILENLAIAFGSLAGAARRHAGGTAKGAHEIGEIAEADIERDVSHRPRIVGAQARGAAPARADQILVRRHAEHLREQTQEVERAHARFFRRPGEIDRLVTGFIDA